MQKIIDVPYLSQYKNVSDPAWQGKACGITCLAMILAYYEKKPRDILELIEMGLETGAYSEEAGGWYDSGLCRVANRLGFVAWRRRWALSKIDEGVFSGEGSTKDDMESYNGQALVEGLYSVEKFLSQDIPVITSVKKDFLNDGHGHLIVLTGYEKEDEKIIGFYYNDSNSNSATRKDEFVEFKVFLDNWNKRGVFVVEDKGAGSYE